MRQRSMTDEDGLTELDTIAIAQVWRSAEVTIWWPCQLTSLCQAVDLSHMETGETFQVLLVPCQLCPRRRKCPTMATCASQLCVLGTFRPELKDIHRGE